MKKILLFGATGGTGKEVLTQALEHGFQVTVIVRNISDFHVQHSNLKVVKGDVLNHPSFENEMEGIDAIVSCLGIGSSTKPTVIYSQGIKNILEAMNSANVSRLICISAGALYTNNKMGFFIQTLTRLVLQRVFKNLYADMRMMEATLERTSFNWTVVRPPMLTNGRLTRKFRIAIDSNVSHPFSISRPDLANYLLSIIDQPETFKAKVEIAY